LLAISAGAQDSAPMPDVYGKLNIAFSQIPGSEEHSIQLDWPAKDRAYYFVEHTEDLLEGFGSIKLFAGSRANPEGKLGLGLQSTAPTGFYRLFVTDDENHPRLLADDDGDTISNLLEAQAGLDAFSSVDGDFNHLPDDWELFWKDQFAIYPDAVAVSLSHRESATQQLYLNNPVSPDADFTVTVSNNLAKAQVVYDYEDSLTGGATYNWIDISTTGTLLANISYRDDEYEAVTLSNFTFPFYGTSYSSVFVSSNGLLTFRSPSTDPSNYAIPDKYGPNNFIAPFWDDQNIWIPGFVYVQELSDRLILQYETVAPYSGTGSYTYQAVLHSNGTIEFFYKEMVGNVEVATIGLGNADGTDGLEIVKEF
jgi:hypothetical protein